MQNSNRTPLSKLSNSSPTSESISPATIKLSEEELNNILLGPKNDLKLKESKKSINEPYMYISKPITPIKKKEDNVIDFVKKIGIEFDNNIEPTKNLFENIIKESNLTPNSDIQVDVNDCNSNDESFHLDDYYSNNSDNDIQQNTLNEKTSPQEFNNNYEFDTELNKHLNEESNQEINKESDEESYEELNDEIENIDNDSIDNNKHHINYPQNNVQTIFQEKKLHNFTHLLITLNNFAFISNIKPNSLNTIFLVAKISNTSSEFVSELIEPYNDSYYFNSDCLLDLPSNFFHELFSSSILFLSIYKYSNSGKDEENSLIAYTQIDIPYILNQIDKDVDLNFVNSSNIVIGRMKIKLNFEILNY